MTDKNCKCKSKCSKSCPKCKDKVSKEEEESRKKELDDVASNRFENNTKW